jgi:hypothetical protein
MSMSTWQIKQRFQANNNKRFNYDDIVQNNKQDSHLIYLHLVRWFITIKCIFYRFLRIREKSLKIRKNRFDLQIPIWSQQFNLRFLGTSQNPQTQASGQRLDSGRIRNVRSFPRPSRLLIRQPISGGIIHYRSQSRNGQWTGLGA